MPSPSEAYDKLTDHFRQSACFSSALALLHWDQRVSIPPKGHAWRSQAVAAMAGLLHERATAPEIGDRLAAVEGSDKVADPLAPCSVNVREWRRAFDKQTKVPRELAVALALAAAEAESAWERARPENDWQGFRPHLEKVLSLTREKAEATGYDAERYDALLDDYEPGATAAELDALFTELKAPLASLLDDIRGAARRPDDSLLAGVFPLPRQEAFARMVAEAMGYDFEAGRLDVSAHPFSVTVGAGDSRITWRAREDTFAEGFFGVLHEAGHAMYEQGLPAEHYGEPMGEAVSLGVHESQSRLWENLVGRSFPFWAHFHPLARDRFEPLAASSLEDFHFAINKVDPGLIRVEADEVTYNLHVLIRFELELALFRDELTVADLPEAWNEKMRDLLGVEVPDHASGVMQDVHWSAGLVGYFPTYTLGNVYAAQLMNAARAELGEVEDLFSQGAFAPLLSWLRDKIHSQGMRRHPRELIASATGEEPSAHHLVDHLRTKYRNLYGL